MNDRAMGIVPNFDEDDSIRELQIAVPEIEEELARAKKFEALYCSDEFQDVIVDRLLGVEAEATASELLVTYLSDDREQTILFELKALRYLKSLLALKANETEKLQARLAENKQLLLDKMSGKEEL